LLASNGPARPDCRAASFSPTPDMARYMLDTNMRIFVMNGPPPTLLGRFNRHARQLSVSGITLAELHYGVEK
jgi:hypothetical protein